MIRPDYRNLTRLRHQVIMHSAKGSTWEEHKYIMRKNGTYYYPDNYEGGRHLPDGEKENAEGAEEGKLELTENDIEKLAIEVIRGNFGSGQTRRDLLGANYQEIQDRVNEILLGPSASKKVTEPSPESIKKTEEVVKKVSSTTSNKVHTGVDMDKVLAVYKNKRG